MYISCGFGGSVRLVKHGTSALKLRMANLTGPYSFDILPRKCSKKVWLAIGPFTFHTCVFLPCRDTKGWRWVVASPEAGAIEPPSYWQRQKKKHRIGCETSDKMLIVKTMAWLGKHCKMLVVTTRFYRESPTPTNSPSQVWWKKPRGINPVD